MSFRTTTLSQTATLTVHLFDLEEAADAAASWPPPPPPSPYHHIPITAADAGAPPER